ncbi:MAG: hypothetical protein KTV77_03175 [Wolbachia endosymbiont of Fragariocoptes setiger]|nr:hypothetical protein [Wolbachia endosymbiont of Fragariocoptes setiger]
MNKVKDNILKSDLVPNVPPKFLDYERTGKKVIISGEFSKSELKDKYLPSCNRAFLPHTLRAYEKGINNLELTPLSSLTDIDTKAEYKSTQR